MRNIDTNKGTFEFVSTVGDYTERNKGNIRSDGTGMYVTGFFNNTIIHHGGFPFFKVMYDDSALEEGLSWSEPHNSNGYNIHQHMEITDMNGEFTTPDNRRYTDVLELTRTITYPEGYNHNEWLIKVQYYLVRGLGFIGEVQTWMDAETKEERTQIHYAVRHSEYYSVTYDANGADSGVVPVDDETYLSNQQAEVKANTGTLEKDGYEFSGWNTASDGSGTAYVPQENLPISDEHVTLYAQWIQQYSITYHLDGGENSENNPSHYTSGDEVITFENPQKQYHDFKGWFEEQTFENQITQIPSGSSGDVVLYAKWELSRYASHPEFTPAAGTYGNGLQVTLNSETQGAEIYYTTNNEVPSRNEGILYSGPVSIEENTIIRAIALADDHNDSQIVSATYEIIEPSLSIIPDQSNTNLPGDEQLFILQIRGLPYGTDEVTINWSFGDGSNNAAGSTVIPVPNQTGFDFSLPSHAYSNDGVYGISTSVSHNAATFASSSESVTIGTTNMRSQIIIDRIDTWIAAQQGGYGATIDTWDISSLPENCLFDLRYDMMSMPDKIIIEYPVGTIIYDSGWRGSSSYNNSSTYPGGIAGIGSNTIEGLFTHKGTDMIEITVIGGAPGTAWNYSLRARE